ncbi:MAG: CrcB family protein [Arhodomonas sp.]|nr:CrcB family protein [Arhodomonas sp.]
MAVGGAAGAVLRFLLTRGMTHWLGHGFPWGTLAVNVLGSLLLGVLFIVAVERGGVPLLWRAGLDGWTVRRLHHALDLFRGHDGVAGGRGGGTGAGQRAGQRGGLPDRCMGWACAWRGCCERIG